MFVVMFTDNDDRAGERQRLMEQHLSFLENNQILVSSAGPLRHASGEPAGGLWIVNTDQRQIVERLVEEDPFWPTGLRKTVTILSWTQVFADGRRLI
jgi:uncharacterized protein YciI